ncbi:MAG: Arm DNA-binding domain-containing protein, partial [Rhodospirillales bacterium]
MLDRPDGSRDERRLRIGVRDLRQLGPGQTIWDTAVIGFGARRQRSAAISFVVHYRTQQGRRRLLTIGRFGSPLTPEAARDEARRVLGIVVTGGDPLGEREARRSTALTVAELCDQWLADSLAGRLLTRRRRAKSAKTVETDRSRIE